MIGPAGFMAGPKAEAHKPVITARRKIGRCANGAERGKGYVYHAIADFNWTALCGAEPGRMSAGWQAEPEPIERVNCPRCVRKLVTARSGDVQR